MSEHESDTVEIIVFYQKDVLLKPYVALITGLDPKYRYAREFLKPTVEHFPYGILFRYTLPCDGIYERSIRTLDKATGKVVTNKKDWFISCDGVEHDIEYAEIPDALDDLIGVWERSCGQNRMDGLGIDRDVPRVDAASLIFPESLGS